MGTKNHPKLNDCYAKAEPDEPMFTLLARDPDAPYTIRHWAAVRRLRLERERGGVLNPEDVAKLREAMDCAKSMIEWRTVNRPKSSGEPSTG